MLSEHQKSFILENYENFRYIDFARLFNVSRGEIQDYFAQQNLKHSVLCRNCPNCNNVLWYSTPINRINAERNNVICIDCSNEIKSKNYKGDGNPFHGKRHSEQTKKTSGEKIRASRGWEKNPKLWKKGQEAANKIPVYICWINKYGKEVADIKKEELRIQQSENSKGEKNGMFGKPSPMGSGNGWSCYYKGIFFRSLKELSYFVRIIERFELSWESGEKKSYRIPYLLNGFERNYFADFLISEKYLIECKPKRLWNSYLNTIKREYAISFCNKRGWKYKMVDVERLQLETIVNFYLEGTLSFLPKYQQKFIEYVKKHSEIDLNNRCER